MNESLNIGLAFVAGVVSFVSPCILPLIPAYLSLMGGTTLDNLQRSRAQRWAAVVNTSFFIVGFTVVFVVLGVVFSSTFGLLGRAVEIVNVVAGILVVLLGINFIFDFIGFLNLERRFQLKGKPTSKIGSIVFGMAFGAGWTPCIGPILGSILFLAGSEASVVKGTILLLIYSIGLGVPFLLTGFFLTPALKQMARLKRHLGAIKIGSGLFLVFIGVLILLGELKGFNAFAFGVARQLDGWGQANPSAARIIPAILFALIALLITFGFLRRVRRPDSSRASEEVRVPRPRRAVFALPPLRTAFFLVFAVLAVLSLIGVLQVPHLLAVWLNFQGI